jgi:hypothetical protein
VEADQQIKLTSSQEINAGVVKEEQLQRARTIWFVFDLSADDYWELNPNE